MLAIPVPFLTLQGAALSKQQADSFSRKLAYIERVGQNPRAGASERRTSLLEAELNSWFAYSAAPILPPGLAEPKVTIVGNGRMMGEALIDLDAIGKRRASGGTLDLWSYLGGRVPLTVIGNLQTKDGQGRFELERAEVSGVPVPKPLLQQLLSHYSTTSDHPQGVRLDDPFALPANIVRIEMGQGQATVVQ